MRGLSRYSKIQALSSLTGSTVYFALLTANPTVDDGTGLVEAAVGGYARVGYTSSGNWGSFATAAGYNGGDMFSVYTEQQIVFGALGASLAAVGWAIYDASTAGNLLAFGPITDASGNPITQNFVTGDQPYFNNFGIQLSIASVV